MSKKSVVKKLVKVNEDEVKDFLKKQVKDSVEESLNKMLNEEADALCDLPPKNWSNLWC